MSGLASGVQVFRHADILFVCCPRVRAEVVVLALDLLAPLAVSRRHQSSFLKDATLEGRVDFHSLRHTFGTALAKAGVAPKVAMDLMRHSDINLTMRLYSHTVLTDRASALATVPSLSFDVGKPDGKGGRLPDSDPDVFPLCFPQNDGETRTSVDSGGLQNETCYATQSPESAEDTAFSESNATVAQLAEQRFCKPQVNGSNPFGGCCQRVTLVAGRRGGRWILQRPMRRRP